MRSHRPSNPSMLVWDVRTRLLHWFLVLLVALAWVSGAAEGSLESFPGEVQPLVRELSVLLDHNAALLERAGTGRRTDGWLRLGDRVSDADRSVRQSRCSPPG